MEFFHKKSAIALALGLALASAAQAGDTISIGDANLDWSLTAAYDVGMRVGKPDPLLTGQANMWALRYNDGDNNFNQWSLVNNRASALFQGKISKGDSGFVLSASTFYDAVYHNRNDNSISKFTPLLSNGQPANISGGNLASVSAPPGQFTSEAKRINGGYSRILDAYGYTNTDIFGKRTNIKLGQHVVSWGESLFFPNISMAQGPLDGSKAGVPGVEIREIMLPEDQISASMELNSKTTLLGFYQFNWHPTVIDASGAYLSRSNVIGPGGICLGQYNPAQLASGNPCSFLPYGIIPETGSKLGSNGRVAGSDITPPKSGSAGIGLRRRISEDTELGAYYLRYAERVPLPLINYAGVSLASRYPLSWQRFYQPNIHLLGASFTTSLGEYVVGGEISQRRGAPVLAGGTLPAIYQGTTPLPSGTSLPFAQFNGYKYALYEPTTANLTQVNLNTFANFGRTFLAPRTLLLAEVAWVNVSGMKSVNFPVGLSGAPSTMVGNTLALYKKNNIGIQGRFQLDYPGIMEGWDLSLPISYSQQLMGQNMLSNLGGKGDKILAVSAQFTRGNLQLHADYVSWLGKPSTDDIGSRVLTDRDFVAAGVKYTF